MKRDKCWNEAEKEEEEKGREPRSGRASNTVLHKSLFTSVCTEIKSLLNATTKVAKHADADADADAADVRAACF